MRLLKLHTFLNKYPFLILLIFLFLAYLPVFLPFFHIKNDLVSQNLPTRFFISESLYSKTFPWWNPYLNYGIPQYGDMNNGYWNPFLWIIAKFFGYSVLTITLEEMLYILIGSWGIYKLTAKFKIQQHYGIICSLSYMAGGFIIGHLQHFCWITGTAFFPYVLLFFISCIDQSTLRNFIAGGLCSFLFISSTHPGLIIGAIYFFLFLIAHLVFKAYRSRDISRIKTIFKASALFVLLTLLFSMVVIVSNWEVLQYITRGSKISIQETILHPTTFQSYLSLFFPFAVHKGDFFNTDISMRNMSIGIALLPGIYFLISKTNFKKNWIAILTFIFFLLLGAGGYFKIFAYYVLPFLGYVRLNGEFAYFTYLMLILGSVYGLNKLQTPDEYRNSFQLLQYVFTICSLVFTAVIFFSGDSILFRNSADLFQNLKSILENLSFGDLCLVSSLLQLCCTFLLKKYLPAQRSFLLVAAINLIVICWGCLPFTGLGQKSREEVQAILNTIPKGIGTPNQKAVHENSYINTKYDSVIGSSAFYSKQVGYPTISPYPVILKSASSFFNNDSLVRFINAQSYLFLSVDTTINSQTTFDSSVIKVLRYTPTNTEVTVQNTEFKYLTFLQNDYPRWKVFLDGKRVKHFKGFNSFLTIPISNGIHKVEYRFDTGSLENILWINVIIIASALFLISQKNINKKQVFK